MGEGGMGRVCPPVTLTMVMVMVKILLIGREWRCLPSGRRNGEAKKSRRIVIRVVWKERRLVPSRCAYDGKGGEGMI